MEIPRHVAVIQDGNRRFAEKRGQKPYKGHKKGVKTTKSFLKWCDDLGVKEITIYALSTENLERDEEELNALFDLLEKEFKKSAKNEEVHRRGLKIQIIGFRELLPEKVKKAIDLAEKATEEYKEKRLNVSIAYGGKADLLNAVKSLAYDVKEGSKIDSFQEALEKRLMTHGKIGQDIDLLIRSGAEKRTSNFLPWQSVGNNCVAYFSDKMWPEFEEKDLLKAIDLYQRNT